MNRLQRLRASINGNIVYSSNGLAASSSAAAATKSIMDKSSTYDALITEKQREIFRLVNESADSNIVREKQIELNELLKSRSIKEFRRSLLLG